MPDFTVPYHCPVTKRFWDAGRAVDAFDGEIPDLNLVRKTFGLSDIDGESGSGYTDAAVELAYNVFVEWLEGKEPGAESGPNSVSPTEFPRASAPSSCCP